MEIKLQKLNGNWNWGRALNLHTISSTPIKDENDNITGWVTKRTEIGEELYKLKYWTSENSKIKSERVEKIAKEAQQLLARLIKNTSAKHGKPFEIDCIIPIPPSKSRRYQPVVELAKKVAELSNILLDLSTLKKVKSTSQLKEIVDIEERKKVLEGAFDIQENVFRNKNVLLFDDLYRSGATLKAITEVIKNKGKAKNVLVLTVTKTKSKR